MDLNLTIYQTILAFDTVTDLEPLWIESRRLVMINQTTTATSQIRNKGLAPELSVGEQPTPSLITKYLHTSPVPGTADCDEKDKGYRALVSDI